MHDQDGMIWYDGVIVPWRSATTHVLTHSLHYGLAVFEGIRVYETPYGPALFRAAAHIERLRGSAHVYGMPLPYDCATLLGAQAETVRQNGLGRGYVRSIAFYGPEKFGVSPRGARVHVAVAAFPWESYLGANAQERGIRVKTSSYVRPSVNALPPRAKVAAGYTNSILANMEALDEGYDEALLLDGQGFVAEGAGENLFLVKNGALHEPEPTSALRGITRDTVVTLASELGLRVHSQRLTRDDVYLADEAFFCGTAAELTPIVELDRRRIGAGTPGTVTRRLMEAFRHAVGGRDDAHLSWLTPVTPAGPETPE